MQRDECTDLNEFLPVPVKSELKAFLDELIL